MKCANCGGTINLNESCPECGIDYSEMLKKVKHPEMKRLFKKLKDLDRYHKRSDIDESLLACELADSSLIIPAAIDGDEFIPLFVVDAKKKSFIILCTDMEEFSHFEQLGVTALTIPWKSVFKFIEKDDGIVINMFSERCQLNRHFLKQYFEDNYARP